MNFGELSWLVKRIDMQLPNEWITINYSCKKDTTLKQITTDKKSGQAVDSKHKRYAFETFNFLHNQTAVYVHAVVKVCQKDDRR